MSQIKLYSYFRSSSAYRVRIALHLKNIDYTYVPVHLLNNGGGQLTKEHKKLNPSAQVPVLEVDGQVINQSLAILMYLDETYPQKPLFSKHSMERAKMIEACEIINSGIQPVQNLAVLKKLKQEFQMSDKQKLEWGRFWITKGFESLEANLKVTAGKFSFGDQLSAVDLFLVPQVYNANRFAVNMSEFPNISKIDKSCLELDAFKKAHPDSQPDSV